jgi:hypothetical protein
LPDADEEAAADAVGEASSPAVGLDAAAGVREADAVLGSVAP